MEAPSVSVEAASLEDLKAELEGLVSQMQSCCYWLWFSPWRRRCQILGCSVLVLAGLTATAWTVYGEDAGAGAMALSLMASVLILCRVCKLPRSWRLVSDLRRLSVEFNSVTATLKRRVDEEVWFPSLSSRWRSVEELERAGADIRGYVETMGSVVNAFLLSQLKKRLKESQQQLNNI